MASFATRLRGLRTRMGIRQRDLAQALGLAQTTIANYEQNTRFPDEEILHRIADYFQISLDYLLGRAEGEADPDEGLGARGRRGDDGLDGGGLSSLARRYMDTLLHGNREQAGRVVFCAINSGITVKEIYLGLLEPALKEVGRLWSQGRVDVAQEHYFSGSTQVIMSQLYPFFPPVEKRGLTAVAAAAWGELHAIGIRVVSDFLEMDGWDTYHLGTDIDNREVARSLRAHRASLLVVSATMDENVDSVGELVRIVRADAEIRRVKILVGGGAFERRPDLWREIGADGTAGDAQGAVDEAIRLLRLRSRSGRA